MVEDVKKKPEEDRGGGGGDELHVQLQPARPMQHVLNGYVRSPFFSEDSLFHLKDHTLECTKSTLRSSFLSWLRLFLTRYGCS